MALRSSDTATCRLIRRSPSRSAAASGGCARTASLSERAELWPRLVAMYADFDRYQVWTDREIPAVICQPVS